MIPEQEDLTIVEGQEKRVVEEGGVKQDDIVDTPNNFGFILTDDEKRDLMRYVKPHKLLSRQVTNEDLLRVAEESKIMYRLCLLPIYNYIGGEAIAHPQIDCKNPLQFFVTKDKEIIINPKMINHTKTTVDRSEGCMSYPELPMIIVQRWNKITVEYQTLLKDGELSLIQTENINGRRANVFQHEMQHLGLLGNNHYIYN